MTDPFLSPATDSLVLGRLSGDGRSSFSPKTTDSTPSGLTNTVLDHQTLPPSWAKATPSINFSTAPILSSGISSLTQSPAGGRLPIEVVDAGRNSLA